MAKIDRFSPTRTTPVQKTGTDKVFGNGIDGTVLVSTNQFLSRDMYYDNLTVNSGVTLFTNGFRVFVKNTLTNDGTVGMPAGSSQTTSVLAGTVLTRIDGNAGFSTSNSIDSANSSGTLSAGNVKDYESLLSGVIQSGGSLARWYAGATGTSGSVGSDGTDGTANLGGAAGGGNSTAGNPGVAGTKGLKGNSGSGGQGGGVVVVVAKTITGAGTFVSEGTSGGSGSSGGSGNAAVAGVAGHTQAGTSAHNPTGHASAHNPVGHAGAHNPGGHNPEQSFHHPAGCCAWNGAVHHSHHSHHHVNANAQHHPGNVYYHSHPGSQYHYSHPGNQYHNPTYPGGGAGTANPGNPGNPGGNGTSGKSGALAIMTRALNTHIASSDTAFVADLDG